MSRCNECCQGNGTHSDACWTGREIRSRPAQAIEARRAATVKQGAVADESAVANGDAPKGVGSEPQPQARAV